MVMSINNSYLELKLDEILYPRIPPFLWYIIIGGEGLVLFFYGNEGFFIFYSCFCFLYLFLNHLFDKYSKSLDFTMYKKIGEKIEFYIYNGEYTFVKYALFTIYLLGITKKEFTILDKSKFRPNLMKLSHVV